MTVKVMVLISSLRTGGKEQMTLNILHSLDRQRFTPIICVLNNGPLRQEIKDTPIYAQLARFPGDIFGLLWRLARIFRRERPQIVLCMSYRLTGWVGRLLARLYGAKFIYEHHGVESPRRYDLDWLDRRLLPLTDQIIALGKVLGDKLLADGIPPHKITVIENGVARAKFDLAPDLHAKMRLFGFAPDTPVIGCVASIRPVKNLPLLVEAFGMVVRQLPESRLVLVGDGPSRNEIERLVHESGLSEKVLFLGVRRDIPDLLRAFDVVALTSHIEAAPMIILEAGAAGRPVVTTRVGSLPDMVQDGVTGFLVPTGEAEIFANRLLTLLTDPQRRDAMGEAARRYISQHYSLERSVRAREALFLRLLEA